MKNSNVNINLNQGGEPKVSSVAKAFKNVVDTIADASWKRLFKVFIVVFFFLAIFTIGLYAYNVVYFSKKTQ